MIQFMINHRVKDYDAWKPHFEEHAGMRERAGCKSERVFRSINDGNEVAVLFEWDTMENAKRFRESDDLRKIMQQAGVIGQPEVRFLSETEKTPAGRGL